MSMNAKEYLQRYQTLGVLIANKLIEKTQWRDIALGVTAKSEGERVQSSGSKQKMADAIDKHIDIEGEIEQLIEERQDIIRTIQMLNITEYDLLHKRYIQGLYLKEIAADKDKSLNWAKSVHKRALRKVQGHLDRIEQLQAEALENITEK